MQYTSRLTFCERMGGSEKDISVAQLHSGASAAERKTASREGNAEGDDIACDFANDRAGHVVCVSLFLVVSEV